MTGSTVQQSCENCGAGMSTGQCEYCGTGIVAFVARVSEAASYVIAPKAKPAVARKIRVANATAAELKEAARKNREIIRAETDVAHLIEQVDRYIKGAVESGGTVAHVNCIMRRCSPIERELVYRHYEELGMRVSVEDHWYQTWKAENFTNRRADMSEYDTFDVKW